jgi:MFS family permease
VNPYAVKYDLGRAWGYSLLSFGTWTFYWFYVTRRLLDGETARDRDDALLHTLGLFVPVLNAFVLYWLYRDLDEVRRRAGLAGLSVAGYVAGGILAAPILYSIALGKVNEFWDARTQGLATEAPVSGGEKAIVAVGATIWILWALLLVLGLVLLIVVGESSS